MTVKELIKWLETQDQDAIIKVVVCDSEADVGVDFTPEFSEYIDFRDNQFVGADDSRYNKRWLVLGEVYP